MNSPLHSPLPNADVAEDFREALSGLKANNKWEIENLTVIARENTEHASPISRVIESHIKTVASPYKLPALYVLDSIVKNVGSPYNIILGRNLFNTFMEAYGRVDDRTRVQMEQMLRTWTQPVPGSMDPKPVFPATTTGVIDNSLKQYKATAFARQQRQPHGLPPRPPPPGSARPPSSSGWGATPVNGAHYPPPPPHAFQYGNYAQPNGYPQTNGYPQQPHMPPQYYHQQPPPPPPSSGYHTPVQAPSPYYPPTPHTPQQLPPPPQYQRPHDFAKLYADIEYLINSIQTKRAANPYDQSLNARLKAMTDLKSAVQTSQPAPHEWDNIRNQVGLLVQQENSPSYHTQPYAHAPPTPTQAQRAPQPPPQTSTPSQAPTAAPQPTPQQSLAQLLAGLPQQRTSTPQTNQAPAAPPGQLSNPAASNAAPAPSLQISNNILELLRTVNTPANNSRPTSAQPASSAFAPPPAPTHQNEPSKSAAASAPAAPPSIFTQQNERNKSAVASAPAAQPPSDLAALLASLSQPKPANAVFNAGPAIEFTSASIKIPRIDVINSRLYKAAPSQCMTCGRRFPGTPEGKARKARHLDYHFRTNKRVAETEGNGRKGVSRAWYPSEREWIKTREIDDADENAVDRENAAQAERDQNGNIDGLNGTEGENKKSAAPYVRAPDATAIQASEKAGQPVNICPICQEMFENRWHDGAQEWVWMDAVRAGTRVYHASCYNEVKRDQEQAEKRRMAEASSKSALGRKRKIEEDATEGGVTKSPRRDGE